MKLSLDNHVLVYAVDRDAGEKHDAAAQLMARAATLDCVLTVQALGEFYHVIRRKHGYAHDIAAGYVDGWLRLFPTVGADVDALRESLATLHAETLSFWDALLWATVRSAGCQVLLSEDLQDGRVLGGVTILNPFAQANAARIEELMRG